MATETTAPKTAPTAAPARARRLGGRSLALGLVLLVALVIASFVGYRYWRDATLYITTDDALIDTTLQTITSPGAGTLVTWQAQPGAHVTANEIIGIVRAMPGLSSVSSYNVTAPIDGTLLRVEAHVLGFLGRCFCCRFSSKACVA